MRIGVETTAWLWASDALLAAVCLACLFSDLAVGKIYNRVTYGGALLGIVVACALDSRSRLFSCLLGGAVGFGFLFPFFLVKGIGGGDVKLIAAVGAIKGYPYIIYAIFWGSLLGGVLALSLLIWKGRLVASLRNFGWVVYSKLNPRLESQPPSELNLASIPYGASLGVGALMANYLDLLKT